MCGRALVWSGTWTAVTKLASSVAALTMALLFSLGERDNSAVSTKVSWLSASLNLFTNKSDKGHLVVDNKLGFDDRKE